MHSHPAIISELIDLLATQVGDQQQIAPETDIISDLAMESVQIMEFMVEVEDHYEIAISLEALAEIRTLQQLAQLVSDMLENP